MIEMSSNERWIEEYENYYSVTRDGRIYSYHRNEKKELKQQYDKGRNRLTVRLVVSNDGVIRDVHTLVARAFMDNPKNHKRISFKDGNTKNTHLDNLVWTADLRIASLPDDCVWVGGFEHLYYIDNMGRVFNKQNKEVKVQEDKYGFSVVLVKDKKQKKIYLSLKDD